MNSAQAADAPESRYEQATAYRRLGGRLIDLLLLSVTIFGVLLLLGLALQGSGKDYAVAIVWMTAGFVAVAYDTLFIGLAGSTPGLQRPLSLLFLSAGFFCAAWDATKSCLRIACREHGWFVRSREGSPA